MIMTKCSIKKNHPTYRYALAVLNGKIMACEKEKLACKRHLNDLIRQVRREFPFVFDETRAERYYYFISKLINPQTMEPFELLPHQKFDFGVLYGWVNKDTGIRRFTKGLNVKSRGNAKSTECSGQGLYALTCDCIYPPGFPEKKRSIRNARIECIAVDKTQAEEVREPAMNIAKVTPMLKSRVSVKVTYIKGTKRGGYIKTLSKETGNKQGGKPDLVIVDEYADHKDDSRVNTLAGGFGKKEQALLMIITTAGNDASNNPAKKEYDYAVKVLKGEIADENYFAIIRETEADDDPHDKSLWVKANPMLRYLGKYAYSKILLDAIEIEHDRAYNSRDANKIREFLVRRLNIWQSTGEDTYLSSEHLKILKELSVPREDFCKMVRGLKSVDGIDASQTIDLTAIGKVFKISDGRVGIFAKGFIPQMAIIRHEHSDKVPYRDWIEKDWVNECEGQVVLKDAICDSITELEQRMQTETAEITYDPAFCSAIAQDLENGKNAYGKKYTTVKVPQTIAYLNEATTLLRNLILERKIVWDGNPALLWCFENAITYSDGGGRIRISKKNKDASERVDLVAAIITALTRLSALDGNTLATLLETRKFTF